MRVEIKEIYTIINNGVDKIASLLLSGSSKVKFILLTLLMCYLSYNLLHVSIFEHPILRAFNDSILLGGAAAWGGFIGVYVWK